MATGFRGDVRGRSAVLAWLLPLGGSKAITRRGSCNWLISSKARTRATRRRHSSPIIRGGRGLRCSQNATGTRSSGGALSRADGRWHPARPGFYLPVRALSRIVRAKFRDRIAKRGLLGEIPAEVWAVEWNVNCQPAGDGSGALQYLAPYVFKVAIGERRILACAPRPLPV